MKLVATVLILGILAACSSAPAPSAAPGDKVAARSRGGSKSAGRGPGKARGGGARKRSARAHPTPAPSVSGSSAGRSGPRGGPGTSPKGPGTSRSTHGGSGRATGPGAGSSSSSPSSSEGALYPAAGDYLYKQSGYREFCSGTCDRQQLPHRQTISLRLEHGDSRGGVIVSEEDSQGGTTRTTTAYRDRVASVQEVYTRVSYDGVNFERTYRPDPPVITLVYPLTVGRDWHGSWKGDVSGDYEAAVASNESVTVGGRHIATRKVFSVTNFRGEFQGRADLTAWIDPQTLAVVRAKGVVHLKSSYGGYNTKFEMILSSGPSY